MNIKVDKGTDSEAKRFMCDHNKDVANRSGGTYMAVLDQIPASKEATQ